MSIPPRPAIASAGRCAATAGRAARSVAWMVRTGMAGITRCEVASRSRVLPGRMYAAKRPLPQRVEVGRCGNVPYDITRAARGSVPPAAAAAPAPHGGRDGFHRRRMGGGVTHREELPRSGRPRDARRKVHRRRARRSRRRPLCGDVYAAQYHGSHVCGRYRRRPSPPSSRRRRPNEWTLSRAARATSSGQSPRRPAPTRSRGTCRRRRRPGRPATA